MHDPKVVAHTIKRPWPQRSSFPATGARGDTVRWSARLHHDHWLAVDSDDYCGCPGDKYDTNRRHNPFPWWKPRSYSSFWRVAGVDVYWPPLITIWHNEPHGHDSLEVCSRRYQDKAGEWHHTRSWKWHVHHWSFQIHPYQHFRRWALTRCAWCGGRSRKHDHVNHSLSWDGPRARWWQGERGLYHGECTSAASADTTCACDTPSLTSALGYGRCHQCWRFRPYAITDERLVEVRRLQALPRGQRP